MKNISPHSITLPFAHSELIGQPLLLSGAFNMAKGYVYFFRHIGTTPVKIGMTTHETVISRFNSFRTYAPYGAEILGFIESDKPSQLESLIHNQFKDKRLSGEFFEISTDIVNSLIIKYGNNKINDIKRSFEIWLSITDIDSIDLNGFTKLIDKNNSDYLSEINKLDELTLDDIINQILIEHPNVSYISIKELCQYATTIDRKIVNIYLKKKYEMVEIARSYRSISGFFNNGKPYKIR